MGRRLGTIFRLLPGISDIVPLKGLGKERTAKNGCPTRHAMGRRLGTIFRLLPGISDIVPLRRTGEKADSQEWLSHPACDGTAGGPGLSGPHFPNRGGVVILERSAK